MLIMQGFKMLTPIAMEKGSDTSSSGYEGPNDDDIGSAGFAIWQNFFVELVMCRVP